MRPTQAYDRIKEALECMGLDDECGEIPTQWKTPSYGFYSPNITVCFKRQVSNILNSH